MDTKRNYSLQNQKLWKTIANWAEGGVGENHFKGYRWLIRTFLPSLQKAENGPLTSEQQNILSDAYYLLGDIHDFNDAPKAAIKAYQKSIQLEPSSGAWRELGFMNSNMGNKDDAIDCFTRALSIDPEEDFAKDELEYIKNNPSYSFQLFREGDVCWKVRELMAQIKHDDALNLLKNKLSLDGMLHKARIYGVKRDTSNYLKEWSNIKRKKKRFALSWADWFYMPDCLWDSAKIWRNLLDIFPRLKPGVHVSDESLSYHYCLEFDSNYKHGEGELVRMIYQFHYYRCLKDKKKLSQLHQKYPKWKNVERELKKLERM